MMRRIFFFWLGLAASLRAGTITVTWADNSTNETGFKIERSTDGTNYAQIAIVGANVTAYLDSGLPNSTQFYYRVRATNALGDSSYSNVAGGITFGAGGNTAPTISAIADQTMSENSSTGALPFTIGDANTGAESLNLKGTSTNTTFIPVKNIVFGGSGTNRTVTVTPEPNQTGSAVITLTVDDGSLSASTSFTVTVSNLYAPTISSISNRTIDEDTSTGPIAFTVGDVETAAGNLAVTAKSGNSAVIPNANIVFGGSDADRTVTITPAPNQYGGPVSINLTVSDGLLTTTTTFWVTVKSVNDAPTISSFSSQTGIAGFPVGPLDFTVGDVETAAGSLSVSGVSSNTTLVPNSNIVFGGSGANRTVTVTSASSQTGTVAITINVSDGSLTTGSSFNLTITDTNTAPTISNIADQSINEDNSTGALAFVIGDAESGASNLNLSGTSSNTALVPNGNIVFGGSGANRTVKVTPAANQSGTATITVAVSDGAHSSQDTFRVSVAPVNDAPSFTRGLDQSVTNDSGTIFVFNWATDISAGPPDESQQILSFQASSDNSGLFTTQPTVSPTGALTYTPNPATSGKATVTVSLKDSGGTSNGGVDTSAAQTFVITTTPPETAPPTIVSQLSDLTVLVGQKVALNAGATGSGLNFQWFKSGSGAISGATNSLLMLDSATLADSGSYYCSVSNSIGTVFSNIAKLTVVSSTTSLGSLRALSLRGNIGVGADAFFVGFVLKGAGGQVLVKAVGPGLAPFNVLGAMADPQLSLQASGSNTILAGNDNWNTPVTLNPSYPAVTGAEIATANETAGALPLTDPTSKDAALLPTLPGGVYVVTANGANYTTGVTLLEFYGMDHPANLEAISLRGHVGTGDNVFMTGFVIEGTTAQTVLIKALGPAIAANVSGALVDPVLDVYAAGNDTPLLGHNDDWGGLPDLTAANLEAGALPVDDPTSEDAMLLITLPPGVYIARTAGMNSTSGIALVELYDGF